MIPRKLPFFPGINQVEANQVEHVMEISTVTATDRILFGPQALLFAHGEVIKDRKNSCGEPNFISDFFSFIILQIIP